MFSTDLSKTLTLLLSSEAEDYYELNLNVFKLSSIFCTDRSKANLLLLWILFCYFVLHVCRCYTVLSVPCSIVITCLEKG